VRGLPHRMGVKATGVLIALSLTGATASLVFGSGLTGVLPLLALLANLVLAALCAVLVWTRPPTPLVFRLIIVAALIGVALLAAAGPVA